jgi:hypothetical protein
LLRLESLEDRAFPSTVSYVVDSAYPAAGVAAPAATMSPAQSGSATAMSSPTSQLASGQASTSYPGPGYPTTDPSARAFVAAPKPDNDDATYAQKPTPSAMNQVQRLNFDPVIVLKLASSQAMAGERITPAQSAVVDPSRQFNTVRPQDVSPPAEAKAEGGARLETDHASVEPESGDLERTPSSPPLTGGEQDEGPTLPGLRLDEIDRIRIAPPDPQLSGLIAGRVAVDPQALRDQFARFLDRVTAADDWLESQPILVRLAPVGIVTATAAVAFEVVRRQKLQQGDMCASGPVGDIPHGPSLNRVIYLHPADLP